MASCLRSRRRPCRIGEFSPTLGDSRFRCCGLPPPPLSDGAGVNPERPSGCGAESGARDASSAATRRARAARRRGGDCGLLASSSSEDDDDGDALPLRLGGADVRVSFEAELLRGDPSSTPHAYAQSEIALPMIGSLLRATDANHFFYFLFMRKKIVQI